MQKIEPGSPEELEMKAFALDALDRVEHAVALKARADQRLAEACRRWSDAHGFKVRLGPEGLRREVLGA